MKDNLTVVVANFLGALAGAFLCGWFVMLLWNWLMPLLFGLITIGYWEACGIMLLCGFLFKNTNTNINSKK